MSEQWKMPEDEATSPQGAGADHQGTPEESFGSEKPAKISRGTLLLFAVFVAGLAMIYFLGMQSKPRAASAEQASIDARVDSAIAELMGKSANGEIRSLFKDTNQLVQMFYNYPGQSSVPVERLPGNPFTHSTGVVALLPDASLRTVGDNGDQERLRKLAEAFASLKLQTILYAKRNSAAMVNNQMMMVGSKINGFTVVDIQPQVVVLAHGKEKFELRMNEEEKK